MCRVIGYPKASELENHEQYIKYAVRIMRREGYTKEFTLQYLKISEQEYAKALDKDQSIIWEFERVIMPRLEKEAQEICGLPKGWAGRCFHEKNCHSGAQCPLARR